MRGIFFFTLISAVIFSCSSPSAEKTKTDSPAKPPYPVKHVPQKSYPSFYITAKLTEEVSNDPCCGTIQCFAGYPFTNDSIKDTLQIIFSCPEFLGKDFFQKGKNYRMLITKMPPEGYMYEAEHPLKEAPANCYFEKEIEKLK